MNKAISKENAIVAYKAFDENFRCRDFMYEVGKEYHINGDVKMCENGFHACKDLMDTFSYYPIVNSRFAIVKLWGDILFGFDKMCASDIEIVEELPLKDIVKRYVLSKVDFMDKRFFCYMILTDKGRESYINGNNNYVISSHSGKKIITNGNDNNIVTTGESNNIINLGDLSNIKCHGPFSNLVSIGSNTKIILSNSSTSFLCGDQNKVILLSDYSSVVSNGNNCFISVFSNFAHCTTNGKNNKINVTGKVTIDSNGINDELVLNGDDIKFRAKSGSTVTCVGKEKIVVGDGYIRGDVWYRYVNGNIIFESI